MSQFHQNFIIKVIDLYGLELDGHQVDPLVVTWLQKYDPVWIVKAIVESLYRGRYKIKSVDNILRDWGRLGKPRHNFTPDYERDILQNLPDPSQLATIPVAIASSSSVVGGSSSAPIYPSNQLVSTQLPIVDSENLDPEESVPFGRHLHANIMCPVEAVASIASHLEQLPEIEPSHDDIAGLVPPSISETRQLPGDPVPIAPDRPQHRSDSEPVNRHLFATLKAIVDPRRQQEPDGDTSVCLPLYIVNPSVDRIKQFKLPIADLNQEQYF